MNGLVDPLSDLSVSGSTVVNKSSEGNINNDSGKIPHKKGPIIDMRAMLNNAIKGATQQYVGDSDPSVSVLQNGMLVMSLIGRKTFLSSLNMLRIFLISHVTPFMITKDAL